MTAQGAALARVAPDGAGLEEHVVIGVAGAMQRFLAPLVAFAACASPPPASTRDAAGDLQVQVVRLEHTQATELAPMVQEALGSRHATLGNLGVVAQPEQNALVLRGTTAQIREALELVARLDVGPAR